MYLNPIQSFRDPRSTYITTFCRHLFVTYSTALIQDGPRAARAFPPPCHDYIRSVNYVRNYISKYGLRLSADCSIDRLVLTASRHMAIVIMTMMHVVSDVPYTSNG